MSFKNIKDVLSRDEMKKVMAGSGDYVYCSLFLASGNVAYSVSGACSGGSLSVCGTYASLSCKNYISWGYSGCSWQCG